MIIFRNCMQRRNELISRIVSSLNGLLILSFQKTHQIIHLCDSSRFDHYYSLFLSFFSSFFVFFNLISIQHIWKHEIYWIVCMFSNEKGMVMMCRSMPFYQPFEAVHPFLYFILDTNTNSILFSGRCKTFN